MAYTDRMSGDNRWSPGDLACGYRLIERLGGGGFGEVWKAHHKDSPDVVVALKIATRPELSRTLKREGVLQFKLRHPGIVMVHHFDLDATPPFLVMEWVPGSDLRAVLRRERRLEPEEAVRILRALLDALAFAHAQGVVHGDLKPENVLVDPDGRVKLTDFGLGKVMAEAQASLALSMRSAAETGGTLAYMSKEQREGGVVDDSSDIYSLGILCFEMLTGERPDFGDLPSKLVPGLSPLLDDVFRRCVVRREERYSSVTEIEADLPLTARADTRPRPKPAVHFADPPLLAPAPDVPEARLLEPAPLLAGAPSAWCDACGASLHAGARYCDQCGTSVS